MKQTKKNYQHFVFRERILKTIKQRSKNLIKNIIVFLLDNFIWTKRRGETKLWFLPIGRIKLFIEKIKYSWWDSCFVVFFVFKIRSQEKQTRNNETHAWAFQDCNLPREKGDGIELVVTREKGDGIELVVAREKGDGIELVVAAMIMFQPYKLPDTQLTLLIKLLPLLV